MYLFEYLFYHARAYGIKSGGMELNKLDVIHPANNTDYLQDPEKTYRKYLLPPEYFGDKKNDKSGAKERWSMGPGQINSNSNSKSINILR